MSRTETKYIIAHTSATPPSWDIGATEIRHLHTASKSTPVKWGAYNLKGKAWSDIGYHFVLPRNGIIELGRDIDAVGAHVRGYNRVSVGFCMVGGVSESGKAEDNYTDLQWRAADFLVSMLTLRYPSAKVLGHRDLSPDLDGDGIIKPHEFTKQCPSFGAMERWPEGL